MAIPRILETERKCFVCHQTKPIEEFQENGRGRRFACLDCYYDGKVNDHHRKTMTRQGKTRWMREARIAKALQQNM